MIDPCTGDGPQPAFLSNQRGSEGENVMKCNEMIWFSRNFKQAYDK
jgi:hypothetical protein